MLDFALELMNFLLKNDEFRKGNARISSRSTRCCSTPANLSTVEAWFAYLLALALALVLALLLALALALALLLALLLRRPWL